MRERPGSSGTGYYDAMGIETSLDAARRSARATRFAQYDVRSAYLKDVVLESFAGKVRLL
jgi:hypothetical protein